MNRAMIDFMAEVSAAYVRRDRMLDALNTIREYSTEQLIDEDRIRDINIAYGDLRDAIVSAAELEVQEYIAMHPME